MNRKDNRSKRYRVYVGMAAGTVLLAIAGFIAAFIGGSPRAISGTAVAVVFTLALYLWMRQRTDI